MAANIEIKARVDDLDELRRRAAALDVRERFELYQKDTFFHAPLGRLKLREFGDRPAELIGYCRPDQPGPKHSTFQRVAIADAAALVAALTLTLGVRGVVEKHRDVLLVGQTRVHLDRVAGLGSFMELEVVLEAGQQVADGERIARALLRALRIDDAALIDGAYIDLLEARTR